MSGRKTCSSIFRALPIIIVILVAGCISGSGPGLLGTAGGGGSPGIYIEKFSSDQDTIFPSETTGINLKIGNGGEFEATNVKATIFGLGELSLYDSSATLDINSLDPADPATGTPADKREASWLVRAPTQDKISGTSGYKIGVRIDYSYGSDGWSEMLVTEKEQEMIKQQEGETAQTVGGTTSAPVETQAYAPKFLLYREVLNIENPVNARVDLVNKGGGTSFCEDGAGEKTLNHACKLTMKVPKAYLKVDEQVGSSALKLQVGGEEQEWWCCKAECDLDKDSDKEYVWKLSYDDDYLILTKEFNDPGLPEEGEYTLEDMQKSLELRGRGKYRSHVCWFTPVRENIGPEEKIPILANSIFGYSTKSELLLAVHGKEIESIR